MIEKASPSQVNNSVPALASKSAQPAGIASPAFLSGAQIQPGRIQRVIHGDSSWQIGSSQSPVNLEVIIQGNWTRAIQQNYVVNIGGYYASEYDSDVTSTFETPGEGNFTYMGNVREFYLDGLSVTTNENVVETAGTTSQRSDQSLVTVRFGNDNIHVHSPGADLDTIHGTVNKTRVGNTTSTTIAGVNVSAVAGMHMIELWQKAGDDPSGQMETLANNSVNTLQTNLQYINTDYSTVAIPVKQGNNLPPALNLANDQSQLQVKPIRKFSRQPAIRLMLTGLVNLNLRITTEFNMTVMRTAMTVAGASIRGVDSFTNGYTFVLAAVKATVKALHTRLSTFDLGCGLRIGNPRIPFVDFDIIRAKDKLAAGAIATAETEEAAAGTTLNTAETTLNSSTAGLNNIVEDASQELSRADDELTFAQAGRQEAQAAREEVEAAELGLAGQLEEATDSYLEAVANRKAAQQGILEVENQIQTLNNALVEAGLDPEDLDALADLIEAEDPALEARLLDAGVDLQDLANLPALRETLSELENNLGEAYELENEATAAHDAAMENLDEAGVGKEEAEDNVHDALGAEEEANEKYNAALADLRQARRMRSNTLPALQQSVATADADLQTARAQLAAARADKLVAEQFLSQAELQAAANESDANAAIQAVMKVKAASPESRALPVAGGSAAVPTTESGGPSTGPELPPGIPDDEAGT